MKRLFFFISFFYIGISICAQPGRTMPYWVTEIPSANADKHYYYRVTMAEATTYDKAYANSFAKAAMEAKWKLGVRVNFSDDIKSLENAVTEDITVDQKSINIPMNKVCDYWETIHTTKGDYIRIYVLWQIAEAGNVIPQFDDFTKCQ
jgi:hypothetical protein